MRPKGAFQTKEESHGLLSPFVRSAQFKEYKEKTKNIVKMDLIHYKRKRGEVEVDEKSFFRPITMEDNINEKILQLTDELNILKIDLGVEKKKNKEIDEKMNKIVVYIEDELRIKRDEIYQQKKKIEELKRENEDLEKIKEDLMEENRILEKRLKAKEDEIEEEKGKIKNKKKENLQYYY